MSKTKGNLPSRSQGLFRLAVEGGIALLRVGTGGRCRVFSAALLITTLSWSSRGLASPVPGVPSNVTASSGMAAQINLSWTAPTPDGTTTSVAAQFIIFRGFSSSGPFSVLFTTANANQTSYSDTNLPGSVNYYYEVAAVNSTGGQGIASSPSAGTTSASTISDLGTTSGTTTTSIPMAWSFVAGAG